MQWMCFVLVFQACTDERICAINTMCKGTNALNHTLIDEFLKRLIKINVPKIVKGFCPKP